MAAVGPTLAFHGLAIGGLAIGGLAIASLVGCGNTTTTASSTSTTSASTAIDSDAHQASPTSAARPSTLNRGPAHPDRATIIDGSWLIGADYPPALYLLPTAVTRCHWRVVDFTTGALIEEGRYAGPGPAAIWVGDGDLFQSEGCLLWQGYPQLTGSRDASAASVPANGETVGDGNWSVGGQIPAGRYRSDRSSSGSCAYRVDRPGSRDDESYETTGSVRSIPAYLHLTLADGDLFVTRDCGTWTRVD